MARQHQFTAVQWVHLFVASLQKHCRINEVVWGAWISDSVELEANPMRASEVGSWATQARMLEACFLGSDHWSRGSLEARLQWIQHFPECAS